MSDPDNPSDALSRAAFNSKPRGSWFDDFEDASIDTVEPKPIAVVVDDGPASVSEYRDDERAD